MEGDEKTKAQRVGTFKPIATEMIKSSTILYVRVWDIYPKIDMNS